jgi:hypothetical protein
MSTLPSPVLPGQIISSKFFNDLIAAMQEFQNRLDAIQSGPGTPTSIIDHFDPVGQQSVGSQLTIFGKFDFPPSLNAVKIADAQLSATDFRAGSNDAQLIFAIPSAIAVPVGGTRDVHIVVSNSNGSDDKIYRLLPAVASNIPNPTIGNVTNFDNPGQPPQTGHKIKITGSNFVAVPPQNNVVTFTIQLAGGVTKTYPPAGAAPAAIDGANTNSGQVVVTVPDIPEIALGSTSPVTVTVDVGSPLPATKQVTMAHL